jgi:hypothetical protein
MFFGVLGWRGSNIGMYVGNKKVGGSFHERVDSIYFGMFDVWLRLVGYDTDISPRWIKASNDKQSHV